MSTEKRKVKLYIQATKWTHENKFSITVGTSKGNTCEYAVYVDVSEIEVEISMPKVTDSQLELEEVKQLEQQIMKVKAASHARVVSIEEKIQSLLAIEHNVEK